MYYKSNKTVVIIFSIIITLIYSCTSIKETAKKVGDAGKVMAKEAGITTQETETGQTTNFQQQKKLTFEEKLVKLYGKNPRPEKCDKIKQSLLTYIPNWKLDVSSIFSLTGIQTPELSKGTDLIFENLPIDASAYEDKYFMVKSLIDQKYGDEYILNVNFHYIPQGNFIIIPHPFLPL